jgi:hypothetical protein
LIHRAGDPEVGQLHHPVARAQQVPGLHVTVDHAVAVGVVQPATRLPDDLQRLAHLQRPVVAQQLRAGGTVDQLHHDEVLVGPLVQAEVEYLNDVGVNQARRRQRLAPEAGDEVLVLGQVLGKQLDGHAALQALVERLLDGGHPADAQAPLQPVAPGDHLGAHGEPPELPLLPPPPGLPPPSPPPRPDSSPGRVPPLPLPSSGGGSGSGSGSGAVSVGCGSGWVSVVGSGSVSVAWVGVVAVVVGVVFRPHSSCTRVRA